MAFYEFKEPSKGFFDHSKNHELAKQAEGLDCQGAEVNCYRLPQPLFSKA
jgi:hypothetical protein